MPGIPIRASGLVNIVKFGNTGAEEAAEASAGLLRKPSKCGATDCVADTRAVLGVGAPVCACVSPCEGCCCNSDIC